MRNIENRTTDSTRIMDLISRRVFVGSFNALIFGIVTQETKSASGSITRRLMATFEYNIRILPLPHNGVFMRLLLSACLLYSFSLATFSQETKPTPPKEDFDAKSEPEDLILQTIDAEALLAPYREAAEKKWEKEIAKLEALDQSEIQHSDAILVLGSSSVRRWDTIKRDLSPYQPIQRGYGGAKFTDMAVFAERLISPHEFRAMVMFIGNGVVGKDDDHTPEQIEELARYIVSVAHQRQPEAPVLLVEITPCERRFTAWPKIRIINAVLREVALSTPHTYFVPTASLYLTPEGTPRPELFVEDKLHLNEEGYRQWSHLIRRRLDETLRLMAGN